MIKYIIIALFSVFLSAISQVLLKKSSNYKYTSKIKEYLNYYVIIGYIISFVCMFLMIIAYKGIPLQLGAVIEASVYAYILIFGRIFFKEKITLKKCVGVVCIIIGIIVSLF